MPGGRHKLEFDGVMLRSEHKRIVADVYSRYDLALKERAKAAYWRGAAHFSMAASFCSGVAVFALLCVLWG